MHHKQPTTLAVKIRICLIFALLFIISCNTMAQKPYKLSSTGKYVLTDSVNKPVKVLMDFGKVKQVGYLYCDTFYFVRYGKLVLVRKEVKSFEIVK